MIKKSRKRMLESKRKIFKGQSQELVPVDFFMLTAMIRNGEICVSHWPAQPTLSRKRGTPEMSLTHFQILLCTERASCHILL